ncbi:LacI family DNA-binding transcriptional regulator [Ilumatobacter sp.]|uniref:LacI family DNA-binding transcriptional regulator n=1 Tax=Ilumatobacter sp. TaxID=1967498 RepID=UPI003C5325F6
MAHDDTTRSRTPPRRLTIEDVATEAGVSVATVSRALRGLPNVTPSTRDRVQAVATRLDYHPDPAATRLAAGRTRTVTLAIPSLSGWYFSTVVAGAEAVCADAGLEFQVIAVPTPEQRNRLLDESQRLERRTDALILVDVTIEPHQVESLERRKVGVATIGSNIVGHPSVCIDDELVGQLAAEHLLSLGHRRFAAIGGRPEGPMSFDVPDARWRGFRRTLAAAGVSVDDGDLHNGNFSLDGGYEAIAPLLDGPHPPTSVFAMSDEMAFGALIACRERSLGVGSDISIIGVDDHEFSRVVELTTIHQPVADHGSLVARLLIAAMADAARTATTTSATPGASAHDVTASVDLTGPVRPVISLIERSTTGPPNR